MNTTLDVTFLNHRHHWHLARWAALSRRERRRLRRHPRLHAQQRAWAAASPNRVIRNFRHMYGGVGLDLMPPKTPLLRMTYRQDFTCSISTSK